MHIYRDTILSFKLRDGREQRLKRNKQGEIRLKCSHRWAVLTPLESFKGRDAKEGAYSRYREKYKHKEMR